MFRKIMSLILFLQLVFVGFSPDYSSCNSFLGAGTNNTISGNITSNYSGSYCFSMASGASLDCQGYTINGNKTVNYIFYPNGADDVTIKNCNGLNSINLVYGNGAENLKLYNISGYNLSSRGIHLAWATGTIMDNVNIERANTEGILINNGENISMNNLFIDNVSGTCFTFNGMSHSSVNSVGMDKCSSIGMMVDGENNTISNSNFTGKTYELYFFTGYNNTIYNNTFQNISKIGFAASNSNSFNLSNYGNTYYSTSAYSGKYCFDAPTNTSCDYFANVLVFPSEETGTSSSSSSIVPLFSYFNYFIFLILVFISFIFV